MKLSSILTTAVLSLGAFAGSAHAQQTATLKTVQWGYYNYSPYAEHEQREYRHGYREGAEAGRNDALRGYGWNMYDHGGYREHNDREYREGFERGYREAFRSNRRAYYGDYNWRDRDWDRRY